MDDSIVRLCNMHIKSSALTIDYYHIVCIIHIYIYTAWNVCYRTYRHVHLPAYYAATWCIILIYCLENLKKCSLEPPHLESSDSSTCSDVWDIGIWYFETPTTNKMTSARLSKSATSLLRPTIISYIAYFYIMIKILFCMF